MANILFFGLVYSPTSKTAHPDRENYRGVHGQITELATDGFPGRVEVVEVIDGWELLSFRSAGGGEREHRRVEALAVVSAEPTFEVLQLRILFV